MRREIATAVLTLPAAVLFLAGCTKQSVPEPVVQTVTAGVAEQIQEDVPERYSASVEPFAQVDLAFKSGGIIEQIYQVRGADGRMRNVEAGDRVSRETQLAQVRPLDYQHRLDSAEAQRRQSEAQLAQVQAQLSQEAEREKLRVAMNRYEQKAALLSDVLQQEAAVSAASSDYENAVTAFWRAKASFDRSLGRE